MGIETKLIIFTLPDATGTVGIIRCTGYQRGKVQTQEQKSGRREIGRVEKLDRYGIKRLMPITDFVVTQDAEFRDETDDEMMARALKDVPEGVVDYEIIEAAEMTADPEYITAWVRNGRRIEVDMKRARDLDRSRIRYARETHLKDLDVEYMRADERGDATAKADVAARKQALRDAPADSAIDDAKTLEELKAAWPLPGVRPRFV